jgi:hypothetical protein
MEEHLSKRGHAAEVISHIYELRQWGIWEFMFGDRKKAQRIMKVAERWCIRKYGINSQEYQDIYGYNPLRLD